MGGGTDGRDFDKNLERKAIWKRSIIFMTIGAGLFYYFITSSSIDEWTPSEWKEVKEYRTSIDSSYNKLFENAANVEDSLRIYQENNLEKYIQLNNPSFEDKERIF